MKQNGFLSRYPLFTTQMLLCNLQHCRLQVHEHKENLRGRIFQKDELDILALQKTISFFDDFKEKHAPPSLYFYKDTGFVLKN